MIVGKMDLMATVSMGVHACCFLSLCMFCLTAAQLRRRRFSRSAFHTRRCRQLQMRRINLLYYVSYGWGSANKV